MSEICGWSGKLADSENIITAMAGKHGAQTVNGNNGALATGKNGTVASIRNVLTAISGKPQFKDPQLNKLAIAEGAAHALASGYLEQGKAIFESVFGAFSIAILDGRDDSAYLATDRSGISPMIYSVSEESLVFGSTLHAISKHPCIKPELNRQAIYDYVFFHMIPGPESIYLGQFHLLPGQYLCFKKGQIEVKSYWKMHYSESEKAPFDVLKTEFLSVLRKSVADAAQGAKTGTFLSGGTDSSTLAGMLSEATGEAAATYSIGFAAEGYDEMAYARLASAYFGTQHHEYYVTPTDVAKAIPEIASIYDQPFGNASAVPTYYCAKLAREDGIERLLGGDGGDELFGGNARYAKQKVFSLYESIPAPLRRHLIEPLAFGLPGSKNIPPFRKLQSYIEQASIPLPGRLESYNLLDRLGPTNIFTAEFLSQIDTGNPLQLLGQTYHDADAQTQINRMLALDLKFTLADNDLPKVIKSCQLAGIDVAFPMLADGVVTFSARLDPELKLKGTRLRYFFKEALRGYLPDKILSKSKHGFGLPFGEWLKTDKALQQLSQDSLSSLKSRNIIRPEFIDELIRLHGDTHSGYYGTMIWVLMMLEQWFIQHH